MIKFPAIIFDVNLTFIEVLNNNIHQTNKLTIKKKSMIGLKIIDLNNNLVTIKEVVKIKKIHSFWKFEFFNPMYEVKLIFEKDLNNNIDFEKFKNGVVRLLKGNIELWDADGKLNQRLENLSQVKSFNEIIHSLKN